MDHMRLDPTRFKPARQPEAVAAGFVVGRRHAGGRVARGPWVSAHPDVILKMGVKKVLHRTKHLGWGADTHLYRNAAEFHAAFPPTLRSAGPRVLKQNRGNGGQGVWKVEAVSEAGKPSIVRVLEALRGSVPEEMPLAEFMSRCEPYFAAHGCIVD